MIKKPCATITIQQHWIKTMKNAQPEKTGRAAATYFICPSNQSSVRSEQHLSHQKANKKPLSNHIYRTPYHIPTEPIPTVLT